MKRKPRAERPALDVIEEAFHLLRLAPPVALVAYYLGSLPFVLLLLLFWSDMSRSAFADERLLPGTVLLTGLFVWMKCWQSVFCRHLLAHLCGESAPAWNPGWLWRTAVYQGILQPLGLFLLPAALALMIPFGWVCAFYNSATVLAGSNAAGLGAVCTRVWRQTKLWPVQNHAVITLFSLFGLFVFLNLFTAVLGVPFLIKTLLGVESVFTRNPWAAMNATLLTALGALTYLCLDPVFKATFVLRCFYGESLTTGEDLRAELRALRSSAPASAGARGTARAVVLSLLLAVAGGSGLSAQAAADPAVVAEKTAVDSGPNPQELDRSIDKTIQRREYSWRLPRDPGEEAGAEEKTKQNTWLDRLSAQIKATFKAIGRSIEDAIRWIDARLRMKSNPTAGLGSGLAAAMPMLLRFLIVVLAVVLVFLLIRLWKNRIPGPAIQAEAVPSKPNLADENVHAAELPEDGWLQLARELLSAGDLRLALRAFYLATLSHLGGRNLIQLARFKSNRDYERELQRRSHALAGLPGLFADNVTVFERVWYGSHPATPEMIERFSANLERMRAES